MSTHKDSIDDSALGTNEYTSKFDEKEPNPKPLNPVDYLIVTRIPMKVWRFQWIIRQFSNLPKHKALVSTCIHVSDASCYQLKLIRCEHGFDLFHVSQKRQDSCGENTIKNQNKLQSNEINNISVASNFTFGSSVKETKGSFTCFGSPQQPSFFFGEPERGFGFTAQSSNAKLSQPRESKNTQSTSESDIMQMEYQITATDSRGNELMKWSVCFLGDTESQSFKIGNYMNNTLETFPNDSLILDCELKVISTPTSEEMPIASDPSLECNGWKKLSKDFKTLQQNSIDTDVTLVVGDEKICAHKVILSSRSPIFDKIFHHDMKESARNSVTITDVEFSALQRLVEFLYSGDIQDVDHKDLNLKEIYDLYYAADKYQVVDLRQMAGNTLLGRIQVDNASELLVWADRHNDEDLKPRIMNFIRINFEEVVNSDAWKSFTLQYPGLAVEVVNLYVKNIERNVKK